MERQTRLKIIFWGSLAAGVGLCVGGVFLPPLLAPGCVLLGASLAMYQSAYSNPSRGATPPQPEAHEPPVDVIGTRERRESEVSSVVVQNNMFFVFTPAAPQRLSELATATEEVKVISESNRLELT